MIDLNARRALVERARYKQISESVQRTMDDKNSQTSELLQPLKNVEEITNVQATINAFVAGFMQNMNDEITNLLGVVSKDTSLQALSKPLEDILSSIKEVRTQEVRLTDEQVNGLKSAISSIKIPDPIEEIKVTQMGTLLEEIKSLSDKIEDLNKEVTNVSGTVEVSNLKQEKLDLSPIVSSLTQLREEMATVFSRITTRPESIKIPDQSKYFDRMIEGIDSLGEEIRILSVKQEELAVREVSVTNFPPQMVPTPVTKIDINPLRGEFKSTLVTVGTTPTPLPSPSLAKRRSLIVFNNHASATLYIGGSNVASSGANTGLPVLAQGYSPPVDADARMILYGVSASSSIPVIVLESSNDYGNTSTSIGNI